MIDTRTQDTAIIRPGRLDRLLYVGPPDMSARLEILEVITRRMTVDPLLDLRQLGELVSSGSYRDQGSLFRRSDPRHRDAQERRSHQCVERLPY